MTFLERTSLINRKRKETHDKVPSACSLMPVCTRLTPGDHDHALALSLPTMPNQDLWCYI